MLAVFAIGRDQITTDLLGSYTQTAYGGLLPRGTRQDAQELVALVGIGTGLIPLALATGWVLHAFVRPEDRESHAFAVLSVCVSVIVSVIAASFVVRFTAGPGLSERYLCYLAPIFFIGMLKCLSLRRAPVTIALGGLFAYWIYHGHVLYEAPGSALAPAAPPHTVINARLHDLFGTGIAPATVLGIAALVISLVIAVPRRLVAARTTALTIGSLVLAVVGWQTYYTLHGIHEAQKGAAASYLDSRDWVDQTLPKGVHAGAILSPIYDTTQTPRAWWEALFYNRTVRLSYKDMENSDQAWGQTQVQELTVNERNGVVTGLQNEKYVIRSTDDHRWVLEGARTLRHFGNMLLQQLPPGPRRVPWTLRGSDETGVVNPGTLATLRVFRDPAQPLPITLTLPAGATKPATVRIDDAGPARTVTVTAGHPVALKVRAKRRPGATAPQARLRGVTNSAQIAVG